MATQNRLFAIGAEFDSAADIYHAAEKFRDAARKGDENYRLGALPIATYTELQKQYLDAVDALLSTQADALEARQQLELLSGINLGDAPLAPLITSEEKSAEKLSAKPQPNPQ